jgi:hypothetical protein
MKELLTQLLKTLPKQTLITLVILLGFFWANDRVKKNAEKQDITIDSIKGLKTEMSKGFESVDNRFNVVETSISGLKTGLSEQKAVTKVIIDRSSEVVKQAARQTQEIYDQMKRDQSPQDRRISDNESYIEPIQPIEKELQVYVEPIKKKLR